MVKKSRNLRNSRNSRKTRKTKFKKTLRRKYYKKMTGGKEGNCPICLENKTLLKIIHDGETYPNELPDHEMCEVCFNQLQRKTCPICRGNIQMLVDTDDGRVAYPLPPRGPPIILELMNEYLQQIPANPRGWNFHSWSKYIKDNNTPFFQQFYDRLSELPDEQLINMYKNVFDFNLLIFGSFVDKFIEYLNKNGENINKKNLKKNLKNIEIIKKFLAYVLTVEVIQPDYFNRMVTLFGW